MKESLLSTYQIIRDKQNEVHLSTFFNTMALQHKFNHKNYGYSSFKDFMNEIDLFSYSTKDEQMYISLK